MERPGSGNGSAGKADGDGELSFGTSRGRWVIAATVLGSGIAAIDATVVGIALPTIGRAFHSGVGTLQWVVSGYSLTLAAFLLLGGSLGDRLGRKRIFSIGVVWFAVASVCCGIAPNAGVLIAARVLQGVGGALAGPGQPGHPPGLVPPVGSRHGPSAPGPDWAAWRPPPVLSWAGT